VAIKEEVKIIIDATGEGAKRAFNKVGGAMHGLGGKVKSAAKVMGVAMVAAGAAIGAATIKALNETKDYAVEVDKAAKTTGVAAEKMQELGYAALQEHADMATLNKGMTKLAKNMGEAKDGVATYSDEFDKMGISVTDATGNLKGTDEVLLEMADYFSTSTDETQKQAIAMNVLGKSGAELIPFLEMGREEIERLGQEAHKMGIVLSQDNVAQFKAYQDSVDRMKSSWKGLQMQAATAVVPAFQGITDAMTDMFVGLQESGTIEKIFTQIGGVVESLIPTLEVIFEALSEILEAFGPVLAEVFGRLGEIFAELIGFVIDSGLLDTLSEIAMVIAEAFLDVFEAAMPLIETFFDIFAGALDVILPVLTAVLDVIVKVIEGIFSFGGAATTLRETEDVLDNISDKWDELSEAEKRATIAQLEYIRDNVEFVANNEEAVAAINERIDMFNKSLDANLQDMEKWQGSVDEAAEAAEEGIESAMITAGDHVEEQGRRIVKETGKIPEEFVRQWEEAEPEMKDAMAQNIRGGVDELLTTYGYEKTNIQGALDDMVDIFEDPEAFANASFEDMHDFVNQLCETWGLERGHVLEIMNQLGFDLSLQGQAGATGASAAGDYAWHFKAHLAQLGLDINTWMDGVLATLGQKITVYLESSSTGQGVGVEHTGGLIKHTGGLIEAAHSGLLVSKRKSNERLILTEVDEYIAKRQAVNHYERKYGPGFFDSINRMAYNPDQRQQHITVYQEIHNDVDLDRALSSLAMRLL